MSKILLIAQDSILDRILAAIQVHRPDKVIVIRDSNIQAGKVKQGIEQSLNRLKDIFNGSAETEIPFLSSFLNKEEIDTESYKINFLNLTESISKLDWIIKLEKVKKNNVVIDISTGNHIACIALFMCGQIHDCNITFSPIEKGSNQISFSNISNAIKSSIEIPKLPFETYNLPLELLLMIDQLKTGNSLTNFIEKIADIESNEYRNSNDFRRQMSAESVNMTRKLDKLAKFGLISWSKGKNGRIEITESGKKLQSLRNSPSFIKSIESLGRIHSFIFRILDEFSMRTFYDRLVFQKLVYLGNRLGFLGSEIKFSWYIRGPYSSDLATYGYVISDIAKNLEEFDINEFDSLINSEELEIIDNVEKIWDKIDRDNEELETLVSIDFLIGEELNKARKSFKDLFQAVNKNLLKRKPKYSHKINSIESFKHYFDILSQFFSYQIDE